MTWSISIVQLIFKLILMIAHQAIELQNSIFEIAKGRNQY